MEMIQLTIQGQTRSYPKGIVLREVAKEVKEQYPYDIILASVDGRLRELTKCLTSDAQVEFLTVGDGAGHKTYERGLILLMLKAFYQEAGRNNIKHLRVESTIGSGIFCLLEGETAPTKETLDRVKKRMQQMVENDIPLEKKSVDTEEAIALFEQYHMYDKSRLFQYRRVSKANIYNLDGFEDYFYGYMPASTGILKLFDLFPYQNGFILNRPRQKTPDQLTPFQDRPKLFQTMRETNEWGRGVSVNTVGDLNDAIAAGDMSNLILLQESMQEKKIAEIAEDIIQRKDVKFVAIAGPSSSGKTSFSHRLSIQLRTHGLKPHPIEVDNYFVNREDTPKDENGKYNFECLEAIDIEKFNEDMTSLLHGKRVELPFFNFKSGRREYKGDFKQMGPDDILVIEGIHGLNERLTYSLPRESKYKIYISALTQLNIDEHNWISTTDGRLIRRMVRDARSRGTTAIETIRMWPSVRRGEEEYIFPYQEEADAMFNSALVYELSVLKQYAEPALFGIPHDCPEYMEAKRLLKFLDYFIGVSGEEVPKNSLLREFIGGSVFKV